MASGLKSFADKLGEGGHDQLPPLEHCLSECKGFLASGSRYEDFEYFMITFMGDYPLYESPSADNLYKRLCSHEFKVSWEKRYSGKEMLQIIRYRLHLLGPEVGEKCWQYMCKEAGISNFSLYEMDTRLRNKLSKRSLFLEAFVIIMKQITEKSKQGKHHTSYLHVTEEIANSLVPGEQIDTPMSLVSSLINIKCDENPRPFVKVIRDASFITLSKESEVNKTLIELEETADITQGTVFKNLTFIGKEYRYLIRHKDSAIISSKQCNGPEGLVIRVPESSLKDATEAMFYIRTCLNGQVRLPDGYILASPLYLIEVDENTTFMKSIEVSISHCVKKEGQARLCVATAKTKQLSDGIYALSIDSKAQLKCLSPGVATFATHHFCLTALVIPENATIHYAVGILKQPPVRVGYAPIEQAVSRKAVIFVTPDLGAFTTEAVNKLNQIYGDCTEPQFQGGVLFVDDLLTFTLPQDVDEWRIMPSRGQSFSFTRNEVQQVLRVQGDTAVTFPPHVVVTFRAPRDIYRVTNCEIQFRSGIRDHQATFVVELSDGQDDPVLIVQLRPITIDLKLLERILREEGVDPLNLERLLNVEVVALGFLQRVVTSRLYHVLEQWLKSARPSGDVYHTVGELVSVLHQGGYNNAARRVRDCYRNQQSMLYTKN